MWTARQCSLTAQATLLFTASVALPAVQAGPRPIAQTCYQRVYDERYVPGTPTRQGYVLADWKDVEVPCARPSLAPVAPISPAANLYEPDVPQRGYGACTEGAVIGGLLGGGVGAASSRPSARGWAIPLGAVVGGGLGCLLDRS
ncbi:glycine zipper 2TM domain-containing protein [Synechococcus sp. RSCCF101]|uniref:glycine zipper 2TM domain-containing protein n=1 Tax=Synechococcus sp. RSCCF101 TaxID=2511069 RepID=UPI00177EE4D1|nr:glycine zipper 2TM domain-containing protein [Synechococcus sp. RSCCF101]